MLYAIVRGRVGMAAETALPEPGRRRPGTVPALTPRLDRGERRDLLPHWPGCRFW
jgi:hypothetical protein